METQVTKYLISETMELIYDSEQLDKWNELIKELGLTGQTTLSSDGKSPIPFLFMTSALRNMCETLCGRKVKMEEFNITPIPVEVLDLIALSKKENYFNEIEVWYDDKDKDPFVVGVIAEWYQNTYYDDRDKSLDGLKFKSKQECLDAGAPERYIYKDVLSRYLIARWADVSMSLEELKKMATEKYVKKEKNHCEQQIRDAQRKIEDLETDAYNRFN